MATRRPLVLVSGELKELPSGDTMLLALFGATTVGDGLLKLPNPGALSFLRINADNTISALAAADFRSAIGAGTSSFDGAFSSLSGKPTTLSGYGITDAQGLDSDLTALAGLSSNGIVARTGSGTAATRTITGTANQVIVTNGDGVSGNPTLSLPQNIATTSTPLFAGVVVSGAAGSFRLLQFYTGGLRRINIGTDGAPESGANAGANFQINRFDDAGNSLGAALSIQRSTGALRLNTYGAGTLVTDSAGNVTASSDSSLKTVTGTFTRGLADVLKLTPRTYHWNEKSGMDTEDENVGFIAQEVLEFIPEAVGQYRTSEVEVGGKKTKKREKAELLTISDRPLIAALVNAVKELKAENDTLSDRLSKLEGKK